MNTAESVIQMYIRSLRNPIRYPDKRYFQYISYSKWTANELLNMVRNQKDIPPTIIVEDFIKKLDRYSCQDSNTSYMFSVAKDTAENVLDLLLVL